MSCPCRHLKPWNREMLKHPPQPQIDINLTNFRSIQFPSSIGKFVKESSDVFWQLIWRDTTTSSHSFGKSFPFLTTKTIRIRIWWVKFLIYDEIVVQNVTWCQRKRNWAATSSHNLKELWFYVKRILILIPNLVISFQTWIFQDTNRKRAFQVSSWLLCTFLLKLFILTVKNVNNQVRACWQQQTYFSSHSFSSMEKMKCQNNSLWSTWRMMESTEKLSQLLCDMFSSSSIPSRL